MISSARIVQAVIAFSVTCAATCFGSGSIGWQEARAQIVRDDPKLIAWVASAFEIAPTGGATRVGHDESGKSTIEGVEVGTRMAPFDFAAKPKGSAGDYTFLLIFEQVKARQWQVTIRRRAASE